MKNVRVLYSYPNKRMNEIVTVTLLESIADIAEKGLPDSAIEEFQKGRQIIVTSAGGWCWTSPESSNGCNTQILPELELTDSVMETVLKRFEGRAEAQGYKPKSKKRLDMQREFVIGVIAAIEAINDNNKSAITPGIMFAMNDGKYLTKENI